MEDMPPDPGGASRRRRGGPTPPQPGRTPSELRRVAAGDLDDDLSSAPTQVGVGGGALTEPIGAVGGAARASAERDRARRGRGRVRPSRAGRAALATAKSVVALCSAIVIGGTGYAWATLGSLGSGMTTTNVFGDRDRAPITPDGPSPLDGGMDMLLVGMDSRTDAEGNPLPEEVLAELRASDNDGELTDTLILVRVPVGGESATAVSIPRDSLVNIPGHGSYKVNSAFGRGKRAAEATLAAQGVTDPQQLHQESSAEGRKLLIETIEEFTGVEIDHYAEVNLLGFFEITDAIGGVTVCLNSAVSEPKSGADFEAGEQTISGGDALAFVRQRYGLPRGDLDRVVRQQVFLAGLANKLLSTDTLTNPAKLNNLVSAVQRSVVLDDGLDVPGFAMHMQDMAGGNMAFETIPVGHVGNYIEVDPVAVQEYMRSLTAGSSEDGGSEEAADADRAAVTVGVHNAAQVTGLAGQVMERLTTAGFTEGVTGNAELRETTVVRHAPGEEANAELVAEELGGVSIEPDANLPAGSVSVLLGLDYSGGELAEGAEPGPGAVDPGAVQPNATATDEGGDITASTVPCVN